MWKYKKFNNLVRILITVFFGIFIVGHMGNNGNSGNNTEIKQEVKPAVTPENKNVQTNEQKTTGVIDDNPTFGFDLNTFINRFNKLMNEADSPLIIKIEDGEMNTKGVVETFRYKFNDKIYFMASMNKTTKKVESVMIMSATSGDAEESLNTMLTYGEIMSVLNPELTTSGRGNILDKLQLTNGVDPYSLNEHYTVNGVKYSLVGIEKGVQEPILNFVVTKEK